ncbi:hypothetical protein [Marinobacter fonticola]|uniref:hypothetical protein n=1 Tax=Marinobacter fonticola TaxID=2603215 RepID=UPI0011E647F8|nr:hypothetical protein [Marinobacter fonticola]
MADGVAELTPTRALQQLEESRTFLQRLIVAASAIEGLKHSVEDMLAQGAVASDDQPHMARFIEGLGRKVRNLSDAEVRLRLEKLDRRIGGLFSRLVPLIEQISSGDAPVDEAKLVGASNDIDALKRLSRTALAVRGMLTRRGVAFADFRLPLDRERLQTQLLAIAREEQRARREVIQQVRVMGSDIRKLLQRPDLPVAMRHLLDQMQAGLLANLEHLKAGHSVAELPLPIETASFIEPLPEGSEPQEVEAPFSESAGQPEQPPPRKQAPPQPAHRNSPVLKDATAGGTRKAVPPGLLRALWLWIRSPWDVSWRDIREGRYRG